MDPSSTLSTVLSLMEEFAEQTGLSPPGTSPRRYLWTDAFAVCNFLGLYKRTGRKRYRELALSLVDQVHHVLGRHREDDPRTGWISGLGKEDGENHPTLGGLRIGKPQGERPPGELPDERLEWERDGQYYHYLTKWMHALDRAAQSAEDRRYLRWAMELAGTAHARFTATPAGGPARMYWKMSIDLSTPLVPSMGQHDPLDGLVTYSQLQLAAETMGGGAFPPLDNEIADMAALCEGKNLATDDPLGTGGLLIDACRIAQLMMHGGFGRGELLEKILDSAQIGLEAFATRSPLRLPAPYRLPFRELGLSIGLKGFARAKTLILEHPEVFGERVSLLRVVETLGRYAPLAESIEGFWGEGGNRQGESWEGHRDINTVMLATSLDPEEFLCV